MRNEKVYFDGFQYYKEALKVNEDVIYAIWLFEEDSTRVGKYRNGLYVGYKSVPVYNGFFEKQRYETAYVITDSISEAIEVNDNDKNIIYSHFAFEETEFDGIQWGWFNCIEHTKTLIPSKTYAVIHVFTDYIIGHVKVFKLEAGFKEYPRKYTKQLNAYIDLELAGFWRFDLNSEEREKMIIDLQTSIAWCYESFSKACQEVRYRCLHKEEFIKESEKVYYEE